MYKYEFPDDTAIYKQRSEFYTLHKGNAEPIEKWLDRVRYSIGSCQFGALTDFLLMDKFICELDEEDIQKLWATGPSSFDDVYVSVIENGLLQKDFFSDNNGDYLNSTNHIGSSAVLPTSCAEAMKFENVDDNDYGLVHVSEDNIVDKENLLIEVKHEIIEDLIETEKETVKTVPTAKRPRKRKALIKKWTPVKKPAKRQTTKKPTVVKALPTVVKAKAKLNAKVKQPETGLKKGRRRKFQLDESKYKMNDENGVVCLVCLRSYKSMGDYITHARYHTRRKHYVCTVCKREFMKKNDYDNHIFRHKTPEPKSVNHHFECYLCRNTFPKFHSLRFHFLQKHRQYYVKKYECKQCNKRHESQNDLEDHIRNDHGMEVTHKCPHCDKDFEEHADMEKHILSHPESKRFICELCGKRFMYKNKLLKHVRQTHEGEKPLKCPWKDCEKAYGTNHFLNSHYRTHTGERPYCCTVCGKSFTTKSKLNLHAKRHSAPSEKCPYCERLFQKKSVLRTHIYTHTGERPFKCGFCNQKFTQAGARNSHQKRMHPTE